MVTSEPPSHLADSERRIFVNHIVNLKNALNAKRVATTNGQPSEDVMVTVHMLEDEVMSLKERLSALEEGRHVPPAQATTNRERLLIVLRDTDWMTAADIACALDWTARQASKALTKLRYEIERKRESGRMFYRLRVSC